MPNDDIIDIDYLNQWIGKTMVETCTLHPEPYAGMIATIGNDTLNIGLGEVLPPLWQWLYFLPQAPASEIGHDGHPKKGGFMPPIPLPRRMWVGESLQIKKSLRIGEEVVKTSKIADIKFKDGKSGPLVFLTLAIDFSVEGETRMTEQLRVVYRAPAEIKPNPVKNAASSSPQEFAKEFQPDWTEERQPDPVLLFRYSALTFNSHRIHYDRSYAMQEEGYPGLVVHGPLSATLLADFLKKSIPDANITDYDCRAVSPLFDMDPFTLMAKREGQTIHLRAVNHQGIVSMEATAIIA